VSPSRGSESARWLKIRELHFELERHELTEAWVFLKLWRGGQRHGINEM
jgi:hypothetical protein